MSWPQYLRRQIEVDGKVISLSPKECELASTLLMRRGPVPINDLIEAVYEDPDTEPDWAKNIIMLLVVRARRKGVPIQTEHGRGYSL